MEHAIVNRRGEITNTFFIIFMTGFIIVIYAMIYISVNHSLLINKIQKIPSSDSKKGLMSR
ncbi:hypothetical protein XBJ2_1680057 [Xenorhabdus bovienii str. Jollieti]|uniref:Uncharacterized protein n=1 Tax=Xenorhabdus bovienii (strain SS-2004) TaxID=406818 RepID=D3V3Z4_XENBS|nr:hypothetical protein XBJ1_3252 [Xenorhabdus bovienii SS-2004]CDH28190.1 hypothetical protein XBJ2_1680057 [Xenorhabdus bovienii str. Jollieti]